MLLDVHTHAFHPKIADKVLAQLNGHYGITPVGTGLASDLKRRVAKAGLDGAVVHTAATDPAQVVPANNWAIQIAAENPGLIGFGSIHPAFPDFEVELDRLHAAGVPGIKIHPDFQGFFLDDPRLGPIFEAARERFVFMVHVGDRLPPEQNPSCPRKLARIVKNFPGIRLIAAHMGGYLHWRHALEHLAGLDLYIDTSSSLPFLDDDLLRLLYNSHPPERILFGSDYPLFDPKAEIELLQSRLRLSDSKLELHLSAAGELIAPGTGAINSPANMNGSGEMKTFPRSHS
jgi:hypothetical protein